MFASLGAGPNSLVNEEGWREVWINDRILWHRKISRGHQRALSSWSNRERECVCMFTNGIYSDKLRMTKSNVGRGRIACHTAGSLLAAASDSHQQLPTNMANGCRDWPNDQNMDCCFVVIGLVQDIPQSFALHLNIDPVGPPSLLASNSGQRIFINIRCQYGI